MEFLRKIRSKSEEERKKILFIVVFFFMIFTLYFWFSKTDFVFLSSEDSIEKEDVNKKFSPFEMISSKISNISDAIGGSVNNLGIEKKEVFER